MTRTMATDGDDADQDDDDNDDNDSVVKKPTHPQKCPYDLHNHRDVHTEQPVTETQK